MLATARTFTLDGISAREVRVEVDVHRGLPTFTIVGLPDAAVRESRERVRSALLNCGFDFPQQRITVNLAPADLRKGGPGMDLAIAAALLAASGQLDPGSLSNAALAGELALDGEVRAIPGVLAMAESAREGGARSIAVPLANGPEAALVAELAVLAVERLDQLAGLLDGRLAPARPDPLPLAAAAAAGPDLSELRGQPSLRRALELAAAGGHSLLIVGPPGAGKSLAARRLPSLLPSLARPEALEVARIASVSGRLNGALLGGRPFRAPHHTVSPAGLVGGGNPPGPGEVTLAHRGVLFLDELGEFDRRSLEALRAPMEEGTVSIVRAGHRIELPCRFMLVAAANLCPCGRGEDDEDCRCSPEMVRRYGAKLSGALSDRIDLAIAVKQPPAEAMLGPAGESSEIVCERVRRARERQESRLGSGRCNAEMTTREVRGLALAPGARALLGTRHRTALSGRGHDRVLRVARTIADLGGAGRIETNHVAEAMSARRRGRD